MITAKELEANSRDVLEYFSDWIEEDIRLIMVSHNTSITHDASKQFQIYFWVAIASKFLVKVQNINVQRVRNKLKRENSITLLKWMSNSE